MRFARSCPHNLAFETLKIRVLFEAVLIIWRSGHWQYAFRSKLSSQSGVERICRVTSILASLKGRSSIHSIEYRFFFPFFYYYYCTIVFLLKLILRCISLSLLVRDSEMRYFIKEVEFESVLFGSDTFFQKSDVWVKEPPSLRSSATLPLILFPDTIKRDL